jgi:hypothetical protein
MRAACRRSAKLARRRARAGVNVVTMFGDPSTTRSKAPPRSSRLTSDNYSSGRQGNRRDHTLERQGQRAVTRGRRRADRRGRARRARGVRDPYPFSESISPTRRTRIRGRRFGPALSHVSPSTSTRISETAIGPETTKPPSSATFRLDEAGRRLSVTSGRVYSPTNLHSRSRWSRRVRRVRWARASRTGRDAPR